MALIFCTECGKQISDKAPACIHCGCPISKDTIINGIPVDIAYYASILYSRGRIHAINEVKIDKGISLVAAKDIIDKIERMPRTATSTTVSPQAHLAECPKCRSTSISADKKGFGVGKAVVGAAIAGPLGLAGGNIGAKKVRITCLNCGHQWMAGKG